MVESWVNFVRITKHKQMFLQSDIFLYTSENSGRIQPVVVLCCKHNVMMRILNKIQLILESNLDFQGFINIAPTHQKKTKRNLWLNPGSVLCG